MGMVSSTDFMRASERPTAIATLNCHRHLTPSCGGHHTYRGENSGPARTITENLTPRPGIREQNLPQPDSCRAANGRSFDDLIGSSEQRGRNRQSKRLGSFEVDHQIELNILQVIVRTCLAASSTTTILLLDLIAKRHLAADQNPLRLDAAILSRMRSEVTSRSNWANDSSTFRSGAPSTWSFEFGEIRQ
jgi:hypothetical protein